MNAKLLTFLLAGLLLAGCAKPADAPPPPPADAPKVDADEADPGGAPGDGHGHGAGPHGGTVIEFGTKYHGEFVVDHPKKQVTVYILNSGAKRNVPIAADKLLLSITSPKFQVELKASPLPNEPAGKSSRFVVTHDNFGKEQEFAGTLSGEVDGKPYAGDFEEKPAKGAGKK